MILIIKFNSIISSVLKVKNVDFFRAYITEDFDHYITRKRRQNCHGNHIEMIALSEYCKGKAVAAASFFMCRNVTLPGEDAIFQCKLTKSKHSLFSYRFPTLIFFL